MGGIVNLQRILEALDPELREGELVFLTLPANSYGYRPDLMPVAAIAEDEGLTLVVPRREAAAAGLEYDGVFRRITLNVHSSLSAVGLTAVVAEALARKGIGANILAAYELKQAWQQQDPVGQLQIKGDALLKLVRRNQRNQHAVRRELQPRRDELQDLLETFAEEASEGPGANPEAPDGS